MALSGHKRRLLELLQQKGEVTFDRRGLESVCLNFAAAGQLQSDGLIEKVVRERVEYVRLTEKASKTLAPKKRQEAA